MMSPNKMSILCRYGGNFVEESDKVSYKDGTNRMILLGAQEINYPSLLAKLLEVCKCTQIGSIRYKHPELGLDCLISIENDEDLCNMMRAFETQNNGLIHLFISDAQQTLPIHNPQNNTMQSGMDHELGMDNHNLASNDGAEYDCANEMVLQLPWPRMELEEGQEFPDENAFHKFLRECAICLNFEYKMTKSGHGRFAAKCIKEDCPWKIEALRLSNASTFKIKSLKGKHTCNMDKQLKELHRQATSKWIADIVEQRHDFQCTPKVIADMIRNEYKIEVSYKKAWRGIELARKRNSIGRGYASKEISKIEKLCEDIRRTNPGSRVNSSIDNNHLKLFISYEAAIIPVFRWACKPVVALSSVELQWKRPYVLFTADALDTDEGDLLLAYGFIEDPHLQDGYKWFCSELFHILGQISNLVLQLHVDFTHFGGVLEVVRAIFPHSLYRYHPDSFAQEIKNRFNNLDYFLLRNAMTTLKESVFDEVMSEMLIQCPEAWEFLGNINPEYWATSHFKWALGQSLKPFLYSSAFITLNGKTYPSIVDLVDHLHNFMMETFTGRFEISSSWKTVLLPRFEDDFHDLLLNIELTGSPTTTWSAGSFSKGADSEVVDIDKRNCSCRAWQILGYPCSHAERAIKSLNRNRYEYWDECYKTAVYREAYSRAVIHPLPSRRKMK